MLVVLKYESLVFNLKKARKMRNLIKRIILFLDKNSNII